jgi:hypothetical protein
VMRGQEWEVRLWWGSECILVGKFDAQKSQCSIKGGIEHKHLQYVDDDGLRHLTCDYSGSQSVVSLLRNLRCDHAGDPCGAACGHEEDYRMEQGAPDV